MILPFPKVFYGPFTRLNESIVNVRVCHCFIQARAPSQWSPVPLFPPGTASSTVRGYGPWVVVTRSCAGTCWVYRGRCSAISCIPSTWSPSHSVNHLTLFAPDQNHIWQMMLITKISLSIFRLSIQPRPPDTCRLLPASQGRWCVFQKSPFSLLTKPSRG